MVGRLRTYMAVVSAIGFAVLCLLAAITVTRWIIAGAPPFGT